MKNLLHSIIVLACFVFSTEAISCVDYHPDSVRVIVSGDSSTCRLEIKVTNLDMFGGSPNEFCSCGIIGAYDLGPDSPFFIDYIVFVDSLTQEPLDGFNAFDYLPAATSSWEDIEAADFNWSGFVSMVNTSGITAGQQVELVIRGHYEHDQCGGDVFNISFGETNIPFGGGFGTDAWDEANGTLMNGHLDVTYFNDIVTFEDVEYNNVDASYWTALDQLVLGSPSLARNEIAFYPNPATEVIQAKFNGTGTVRVFDALGQMVHTELAFRNLTISVSGWNPGVYIVELNNNGNRVLEKIVVE